jgi:hypothetical protein
VTGYLSISSVFLSIISFVLEPASAQTILPDSTSEEDKIKNENIIESIMSYSDDVSEVFAGIDLNSGSPEDLLLIPGMTSEIASSIIAYRRGAKFIYDMDELSNLNGMTPELLSSIKTHSRIYPRKTLAASITSYTSLSPQRSALYHDEYNENGIMNFQKLHFEYENFGLDAVTDKDGGEKNYLDFYSLALMMKRVWIFSAVEIGDYTISLGNGILFSSAGAVSKSASAISPLFIKRAYSLKPSRSRSESGFLRGAAFSIPFREFEFTSFASIKNLDAHVNESGFVTSIDYTGLNLYTTASDMNLEEKIAGGILRFNSPYADVGVTGVYFSYDHPFVDRYRQRQLVGDAFLRIQSGRDSFSSELLADKVVSFSANASLDYREARFAVGLRNLRSQVVPNYSGALSESFPTAPEQGVYLGATFDPAKEIKIGFYYDRFRILSLSNDPDRNGEEIFSDCYVNLSRVIYPFNGKRIFEGTTTTIYMRYKYKTKEDFYIPITDFPTGQSTLAGSKQNFRIDLRHNFSSSFSIRARFEKNFLSSGENGELFLIDPAWKLNMVSFDSRICFYKTGSYNTAFYGVEGDLPGMSQYTLMYGDGLRLMMLASAKMTRSFSVGIKISRDIFDRGRQLSVGSASVVLPGVTYLSFETSYTI